MTARFTTRLILTAFAAALAALPAAAQVKRFSEIKSPPLPAFEVPQPSTFTLPNGLRVFLMEDHEIPVISVRTLVRTGAFYEPQDKIGLARLAGVVQRTGGTTSMPGDRIDDFLEARAASVETGIGGDSGTASMNCLKQDFDEVFKVYLDVLRNPAFAQDKLDIAKVGANASIARRNDNVGGITGREIGRLVYGPESPFVSLEEYATIAAITRDDLARWHKTYYHPNNMMLGVSGDFDSKVMRKTIEKAFASWPKGPAFVPPKVAYRERPNPGVFFIEKPDVTQVNIAMAHLGIEQKNPDFFPAQVMNAVLGGGFSGRLTNQIRTKKGLAYGVNGGWARRSTGRGSCASGCRPSRCRCSRDRRAERRGRRDHQQPAHRRGDGHGQGFDLELVHLQLRLALGDPVAADDLWLLRPAVELPGDVPDQRREGHEGRRRPRREKIRPHGRYDASHRRKGVGFSEAARHAGQGDDARYRDSEEADDELIRAAWRGAPSRRARRERRGHR
jgi:predicted Zn-dependent peptidase